MAAWSQHPMGSCGANAFQGANGAGTVYMAAKDGSFLQKIYDFPGPESSLGGGPWATLMQHTNGILYGLSVVDNGGIFTASLPAALFGF